CTRIAEGMAMDVVEIDGASNRGIDEMREIRERVRYAPTEGKYKIYIIDEVHMLTNEAFNALLKCWRSRRPMWCSCSPPRSRTKFPPPWRLVVSGLISGG